MDEMNPSIQALGDVIAIRVNEGLCFRCGATLPILPAAIGVNFDSKPGVHHFTVLRMCDECRDHLGKSLKPDLGKVK
jgi:hypothetical protein